MLRLIVLILGLSLCAHAQNSSFTFFLGDIRQVPASVLQNLHTETGRILSPLGLALEWRDSKQVNPDVNQLVVVRFAGSCSFAGYNPAKIGPTENSALASTAVADGRILPFITVECGKLRDRLGPLVIGLKGSEREAMLGRAAGRLLAHEVYHVLSGERRHAQQGVAQSCVTTRELLAENFDLNAWSLAQMRTVRLEPIPQEEFEADLIGRD